MIKDISVSLEKIRVDPENNISRYGPIVTNKTAWRDTDSIPSTAPNSNWDKTETLKIGDLEFTKKTSGIVSLYEKLPIKLYQKSNAFYSEYLQNLIPPSWDTLNQSYKVIFYNSETGNEVPYGMGNPKIDNSAGIILFDEDYLKSLSTSTTYPLLISFYRYEGVIGFYGSIDEERFPRRDNLPLIKSADDYSKTARFVIKGTQSDNYYTLPNGDGGFLGEHNTIVLEDNFQAVFDRFISIDGGTFIPS